MGFLSIVQANFENDFIAQVINIDKGIPNINFGFNSGGYERYQYFVTDDGSVLGINTVMANIQNINFNDPDERSFYIVGVQVNYNDDSLIDDYTGETLESAYSDESEEEEEE
ncbi:hypothetical protein [Escherichia phage UPEC06]|nr:hypothetical protein [Escherichia phage UPEC06]